MFVGYFIEKLDDKLVFKQLGLVVTFLAIVAMNLFSDYIMAIADNSSFKVDEIQQVIETTDAGLVYFWDSAEELIPTYEVIRVTDTDRVYKGVFNGNILATYGQYKYYDDSTEYSGPTVLVTPSEVPEVLVSQIDNYELIEKIDSINIYYSKNNPIDLLEMTGLR